MAKATTLLTCARSQGHAEAVVRQAGGLAARSERVAAQEALVDLPLATFLSQALVPYEADALSRLIIDSHDPLAFALVAHLSVGAVRDWLLVDNVDAATLAALAPGWTPEMLADVSKLMSNPGKFKGPGGG